MEMEASKSAHSDGGKTTACEQENLGGIGVVINIAGAKYTHTSIHLRIHNYNTYTHIIRIYIIYTYHYISIHTHAHIKGYQQPTNQSTTATDGKRPSRATAEAVGRTHTHIRYIYAGYICYRCRNSRGPCPSLCRHTVYMP